MLKDGGLFEATVFFYENNLRELLIITLWFFIYFFNIWIIIQGMKLKWQKTIICLIFLFAGILYAQPAPSNPSLPPPQPHQDSMPELPPKLPPKDESRIFNYRGNRAYSENLPLKICQVKCTRFDQNTVSVEIVFNQNINPRSFKQESVFIDNNLLPDFCKFSFNRRGDTIKFVAPVNSQTFKLKIQNVRSFNGNIIDPIELLVEVRSSL